MNHHPKSETLARYAAGALDEARSVVVAAHLSMCGACRRAVADYECVGGMALGEVEPEAMSAGALDSFWSRAGAQEQGRAVGQAEDVIRIPEFLARRIAQDFSDVEWKPFIKGFSQALLEAKGYRPGALRLLKIEPGVCIPKHTHAGGEFTLILKGAYEDEIDVFAAGDFADLDREDTHSPKAIGEEPCICLVATDAPLIFDGLVAKIAQRFVGL